MSKTDFKKYSSFLFPPGAVNGPLGKELLSYSSKIEKCTKYLERTTDEMIKQNKKFVFLHGNPANF